MSAASQGRVAPGTISGFYLVHWGPPPRVRAGVHFLGLPRKGPQTRWFETTEGSSLPSLEARHLGAVLEEGPSLFPELPGNGRNPAVSWLADPSLQCLPCHVAIPLCVCVILGTSYKDPCHWIESSPYSRTTSSYLTASAKMLFVNKDQVDVGLVGWALFRHNCIPQLYQDTSQLVWEGLPTVSACLTTENLIQLRQFLIYCLASIQKLQCIIFF